MMEGLYESKLKNYSGFKKLDYIYREIKRNWKNTNWWKSRFMYYIVRNYFYKIKKNKGEFVMEKDWDNLIILDACRYDTFVEVYGKPSEYIISRGSSTREFLEQNFVGRIFRDTVYVTASPWVDLLCKNSFVKVISLWKDYWDNEIGTVFPDVVRDIALEVSEKYPDKRLIIHFIQPHHPFIKDPELNTFWKIEGRAIKPLEPIELKKDFNPFEEVKKGRLELKKVYKAYKRNLEAVLPHALKLAKELEGKSVISADHGEAFGEIAWPFPIRIYGHPSYVHIPALVKVPWLVINKNERKRIRVSEKDRLKLHISRIKKRLVL